MDRLVTVDVKDVVINFRPSQRCVSAAFTVTNLMHTMAVAVQITTSRPALYSLSPDAAAVLPPLSTASFTLVLHSTVTLPIANPADTILVRSAVVPTGRASAAAVSRLFSRPGVHVFRDASLPITLVGPDVIPALLGLPDSLEAEFLLSKAVLACSPSDMPDLLCRAAAAGNPRFVSVLIRAGADPAVRGTNGDSALCLAVASGSTEAVRALLDAGARVDLAIDRPFHDAAAAARADLISLLVEATDPEANWANVPDPSGRTPTHAAAAVGALDVLGLCLDFGGGGDPDRTDEQGWTPLHCAAAGGHLEVAELLVDSAAYDAKRVLTGDKQPKAPFELAADGGHTHLYNLLRLRDVLHAAAGAGDNDTVEQCLAVGVEVDARDQNGWTALHRAAFKGRIEVLTALIDGGAQLDAVDDAGYTALQWAVEVGHADVALCLVARGARTKGIVKGAAAEDHYSSRGVKSCWGWKAGMEPLRGNLRLDII